MHAAGAGLGLMGRTESQPFSPHFATLHLHFSSSLSIIILRYQIMPRRKTESKWERNQTPFFIKNTAGGDTEVPWYSLRAFWSVAILDNGHETRESFRNYISNLQATNHWRDVHPEWALAQWQAIIDKVDRMRRVGFEVSQLRIAIRGPSDDRQKLVKYVIREWVAGDIRGAGAGVRRGSRIVFPVPIVMRKDHGHRSDMSRYSGHIEIRSGHPNGSQRYSSGQQQEAYLRTLGDNVIDSTVLLSYLNREDTLPRQHRPVPPEVIHEFLAPGPVPSASTSPREGDTRLSKPLQEEAMKALDSPGTCTTAPHRPHTRSMAIQPPSKAAAADAPSTKHPRFHVRFGPIMTTQQSRPPTKQQANTSSHTESDAQPSALQHQCRGATLWTPPATEDGA
ncbi:hypothetical protein LTR86_000580 [Recurvomyces mirabilis]|nr:hypothetical protein LTR86_000580 [Recurvomyces mirabilis]